MDDCGKDLVENVFSLISPAVARMGDRLCRYLAGPPFDTGRPATQGIVDCGSFRPPRWRRSYFRLLPSAPSSHEPAFHLAWIEEYNMKPWFRFCPRRMDLFKQRNGWRRI